MVEHQRAGDAADRVITKRRDERPQRVGSEYLTRVSEDENRMRRARDASVERQRLAAERHGDDVDLPAEDGQRLERPIGRSVGDDDDLTPIRRVVEREQVLDASRQPERFVSGGEDNRHAGQAVLGSIPPGFFYCSRGPTPARDGAAPVIIFGRRR